MPELNFEFYDVDIRAGVKPLGMLLQALVLHGGHILNYNLSISSYKNSPTHCVPITMRVKVPTGKREIIESHAGTILHPIPQVQLEG